MQLNISVNACYIIQLVIQLFSPVSLAGNLDNQEEKENFMNFIL